MARSLVISAIDRQGAKTYIRWGNHEAEIDGGLPGVKQWVREQIREADEVLVALALEAYFARDPNLTTPAQLVGKTVTLDLAAGKVSYADALLRIT